MRKQMACLLVVLCGVLPTTAASARDSKRPNIIFIMADDLGNADLGYRGGQSARPISTSWPTMASGWKSFYGEPVSPPRAPR